MLANFRQDLVALFTFVLLLATAAIIILITSAGGAFGGMLRNAGVGDAIKSIAQTYSIDILFLGWLTAAVIRIAQGSATVAMITASAVSTWMVRSGEAVSGTRSVGRSAHQRRRQPAAHGLDFRQFRHAHPL